MPFWNSWWARWTRWPTTMLSMQSGSAINGAHAAGIAIFAAVACWPLFSSAQDAVAVQIGEYISVCIDPPNTALVVRAELEKTHEKECTTWSRYRSTVATLAVKGFRNCTPTVPPVNQFAGAILSSWSGTKVEPPGSGNMFSEPLRYGLRALRDGDTRANKLIVWSGGGSGMVAVVIKDENASASGVPDLSKLQILYPSDKNCGELRMRDAQTVAKSLSPDSKFKLLEIFLPKFYWNHWIDGDGLSSQTDALSDQDDYRYRIDFSALDFRLLLANPGVRGAPLKPEEVQYVLPNVLPTLGDLRIVVLPFGNVELLSGQESFEKAVRIRPQNLRATLTSGVRARYPSLNAIAEQEGALRWEDERGIISQISLGFRVTGTGCSGFSVIVWSNQGDQPRLVAAWTRGFFAYRANLPGAIGKDDDKCGQSEDVARGFDPSVVVPLFPVSGVRPAARLTFVDLNGASIGTFEDLGVHGAAPLTWVLESKKLRETLSEIVTDFDKRVTKSDFEAYEISEPLEKLLFACRIETACRGSEALARLRDIANSRPGERIEVRFRDSSNATYYVPIQLLRANAGGSNKLLGEQIRTVYPLPTSNRSPRPRSGCVNAWIAALVVRDDVEDLTIEWQHTWPERLSTVSSYQVGTYLELSRLREFFKSGAPPKSAEGLVLLAHHGGGRIAERGDDPGHSRMGLDHVNRTLQPGSFGLFAACSVGAVGQGQQGNALFLHGMNQRNMDAAIVSPYKVPNDAAKALLESFRDTIVGLKGDATLHEVFVATRARLLNANKQKIQSNAKLLMLLGDGDIRICKP